MAEWWTSGVGEQVVWLFGHPVGHSLSPAMHNAAFRCLGLDMRYVARDVAPDDLGGAVCELRTPNACGANVTLPHKERVMSLLDHVEAEAAGIGAVNTIVNDSGRLIGHNTDARGFTRALRTGSADGAEGLECLVLGAGGAARAVMAGLQQERAKKITVANRDYDRAVALCETGRLWGGAECVAMALEGVERVCSEAQIIVNATSVGLPGSVKDSPIDVDKLRGGQVLVDLVYGTRPTTLIEQARLRGLVAVDGREMLVQQAALSFELWTGRKPPVDVMRGSIGGC